ncbi:MAG: CAP domain-containing protein [Trueperaceae bacterium]|nr:CAP domain-containing protein [Trueperaceae bacterium]
MRRLSLGLLVLATLFLGVAFGQSAPGALQAVANGLLEESNIARQRNGLGALTHDPLLAAAATAHAREMAEMRYFDHVSPVRANATLSMRVTNAGSPLVEVGENLARLAGVSLDSVPTRVVQGWLDSPSHRRNLLNGSFNRVGFGLYDDPQVGLMVVQVLGWEPYALLSAQTSAATRTEAEMVLRFDSRTAIQVVLSFGGGNGTPIDLPAGVSDVVLTPVTEDTELAVGVRQGNSFFLDEAATLHAAPILLSALSANSTARGTYTLSPSAPRRHTRIVNVFAFHQSTDLVRVDLDYAGARSGSILVLFDDTAWTESEVAPGRFELELDAGAVERARRNGNADVLVGIDAGGGNVRVFHRFDLNSVR